MITPTLDSTYYSVGPLQHSGIEQWTWTNDRYDRSRLSLGNIFSSPEEAAAARIKLTEYLAAYHNLTK